MCASNTREGSRPSGHLDILSGARRQSGPGPDPRFTLLYIHSTEYGWFYSQFYTFTLGTSLGFVWDGLCHVGSPRIPSKKSQKGQKGQKGKSETFRSQSQCFCFYFKECPNQARFWYVNGNLNGNHRGKD